MRAGYNELLEQYLEPFVRNRQEPDPVKPVPLHHVWQYTDVDRAFWQEHLEDWLPAEIIRRPHARQRAAVPAGRR